MLYTDCHPLKLVVKEIRTTIKDLSSSPSKKYSYHEWAWFMRLLGEDESDPRFHEKPTIETTPNPTNNKTTTTTDHSKSDPQPSPWSWMGINSPLLGETGEAEWVLERLVAKLEEELKSESERRRKRHQGEKGAGVKEKKPPVTEGSREEQGTPVREDG